MKKNLCILFAVFAITAVSFAQSSTINSTLSNIQQGVIAKYSPIDGLSITFNKTAMTAASQKALASGNFIVDRDITLTTTECAAIHAPANTFIPAGQYVIVNLTRGSGDPLKGLNVSKAKKHVVKK